MTHLRDQYESYMSRMSNEPEEIILSTTALKGRDAEYVNVVRKISNVKTKVASFMKDNHEGDKVVVLNLFMN